MIDPLGLQELATIVELGDAGPKVGVAGTIELDESWERDEPLQDAIFADRAFAIRNRPVTCYHSFDARGFAFWSKPEDYVGRTGLLLVVDEQDEAATRREYAGFFERMAVVAEFPMMRGHRPFLPVKVYRCDKQTIPYPFDYRRK